MGLYNVVKPCVVGPLHYARPTTQPIEIDDEVAAPLVESGELVPYRAAVPTDHEGTSEGDPPADESPTEKPRGRRKVTED